MNTRTRCNTNEQGERHTERRPITGSQEGHSYFITMVHRCESVAHSGSFAMSSPAAANTLSVEERRHRALAALDEAFCIINSNDNDDDDDDAEDGILLSVSRILPKPQ